MDACPYCHSLDICPVTTSEVDAAGTLYNCLDCDSWFVCDDA